MAYTTQQLLDIYQRANGGVAANDASKLAIDAWASQTAQGGLSDDAALSNTIGLTNNTTAVAAATYQFFTGAAPSEAGLTYFLNSADNANDLNDASGLYAGFNQESRFINFSINLALGSSAAAGFASSYGGVTYKQTVATAYDKIIGNSVAAAKGVDVAAAVDFLSRQANVDALTQFVKANNPTFTTAQVDLAVKAALIGEILNIAVSTGLGGYAYAVNAYIKDYANDGHLDGNAAAGVDIINAYPSVPPVTSYSLTANVESLNGSAGNDTFAGVLQTAAGSTVNAGDTLNGGAGEDTLAVTFVNGGAGTALPVITLNSIENISARNIDSANAAEISMLGMTGVTGVESKGSLGDLAITNGVVGATYKLTDATVVRTGPGDTAGLSVAFNGADLTSAADTVKFSVSNVGNKIGTTTYNAAVGYTVAGPLGAPLTNVEAVSVATSGTNYFSLSGAADTKTVTITGAGVNTIDLTNTGFNTTTTIDMSGATGTNVVNLGATLTTGDKIVGGTGQDTISVNVAAGATSLDVAGVETLRIAGVTAAGQTLSFKADPGLTTVEQRATNSVTLAGVTSLANLNYQAAGTVSPGNTTFGAVTLGTAFNNAADVLAVGINNQGAANTGTYGALLTASGIESVNVTVGDTVSTAKSTFSLVDVGLKTLTATSAGVLDVTVDTRASSFSGGTTSTSGSNSVTSIDLSGVSSTAGVSTITVSVKDTFAAAAEVKASVGGTTIVFQDESATDTITFTGNKGVDNVTTGTIGKFVANLGEGNDVFDASAIVSAANGSVTVDGGIGNDTITGSAGADTLVGGDGDDILTGGLGADILVGGAGSDTYKETMGSAVNARAQVSTLTPVDLETGEVINVTIGGQTYQTTYVTSVAATLDAFVTAHANTILALNGVTVTHAAGAASLVFTGNAASGAAFTAPTATITGGDFGNVVSNLSTAAGQHAQVVNVAGIDGANDKLALTLTPATGTATTSTTVDWQGSLASTLQKFVQDNPTLGLTTNGFSLFYQGTGSITVAAGTDVSHGTDTTTAVTVDTVVASTAAVAPIAPSTVVSSSTAPFGTTAAGIDQITWGAGDKLDVNIAVSKGDSGGAIGGATTNVTIDGTTGLATFGGTTTPANLLTAVSAVEAAVVANGHAAGETALFAYDNATYLFVSDGVAGVSGGDLLVQLVGVNLTAASSFTIDGSGDITSIA